MCEVCDKQGAPAFESVTAVTSESQRVIALLTEIRDRLTPPPSMNNEQAALNIVRSVGQELASAANALDKAARRLQDKGDLFGAREIMAASKRAQHAAEGLTGG